MRFLTDMANRLRSYAIYIALIVCVFAYAWVASTGVSS